MGDIAISNGTCYTAAGERLDDSFIPCGNTAYGFQTCCGAGDNCLADLACFGIHGSGYGSFLTYFAGCTDPEYNDPSCPRKEVDQPWVALTLCDNSEAWAICSQPGNPSTLQPGATCSCTNTASATIAFRDATVIANHVSLPASEGETVSYFPGYSPTGTLTAAAATGTSNSGGGGQGSSASDSGGSAGTSATSPRETGATSSRGGTSSAGASATSGNAGSSSGNTADPSTSSSSGIGTGAIVGIVIGAIVALLLLAVLGFLLFRRRRKQSRITEEKKIRDSGLSTSPMKPGGLGEYVRPTTPPVPEMDSIPVAEAAGTPAQPWLLRSELDGKEIPSGKNSTVGSTKAGSTKGTDVASTNATEGRYELP